MPIAPRYVVVLDAAHGGPETGARLRDQPNDLLLEKDLLLALSVRLRSVLTAHGIAVVTTRESDTNPPPDARAATANRAHASACLLLHATTSGTGVHLYTSALAPTPAPSGVLRPWATAQAPYLTQSLKLSSDISAALTHAAIPVILGSISLAPVDNMACPAVILELAPLLPRRGKPALALNDSAYQTRLVDALGGALEQWRSDSQPQP
jgi:N-acetylmuramoyl-L-alanine amidase